MERTESRVGRTTSTFPFRGGSNEKRDYARFDVKPGITGPRQVAEETAPETAYIREWSLWADLRLLLRTLPAVLNGRGAL